MSLGRFAQKRCGTHGVREHIEGNLTVEVILATEVSERPKVSDEDIGSGADGPRRDVPVLDRSALAENAVEPLGDPPGRMSRTQGTSVGAEVVRPVGEDRANGAQRITGLSSLTGRIPSGETVSDADSSAIFLDSPVTRERVPDTY
jgi:hypothetical protein